MRGSSTGPSTPCWRRRSGTARRPRWAAWAPPRTCTAPPPPPHARRWQAVHHLLPQRREDAQNRGRRGEIGELYARQWRRGGPWRLGCGGPKAHANQRSSRPHEPSTSGAAACAVRPPWRSPVAVELRLDAFANGLRCWSSLLYKRICMHCRWEVKWNLPQQIHSIVGVSLTLHLNGNQAYVLCMLISHYWRIFQTTRKVKQQLRWSLVHVFVWYYHYSVKWLRYILFFKPRCNFITP
jgi:hypothetical protein